MDNSIDIYLHKKFKKQTSIDCRQPQRNNVEKENQGECHKSTVGEKTLLECYGKEQCAPSSLDNKERHLNHSTNEQSLLSVTSSNNLTSSISLKTTLKSTQSSNSCISYVVSSRDCSSPPMRQNHFNDPQQIPVEISSHVVRTSENVASKEHNVLDQRDISFRDVMNRYCEDVPNTITEPRIEEGGPKSSEGYTKFDDVSAPPDRPSGGKYVCTYCNLACSKPSVLQKHIRAHTNERPYPCIQCGFSFKTRSNLYKHCRSRTHANRVMGNKSQENGTDLDMDKPCEQMKMDLININNEDRIEDLKSKPYKPRFHTGDHLAGASSRMELENSYHIDQNMRHDSEGLSNHINNIIDKNNSLVNPIQPYGLNRQVSEVPNEGLLSSKDSPFNVVFSDNSDEPLNLTNKCRKRCVSEVQEPTIQKSLIKELLLKSLYADTNLQCPHCKMIFQTVTEFELHKLRSCKGFTHPGMKYSRSSSVNVASILTHNKNAFDNIPHLQNTVFPMKSPGPFLGKTRLVEGERTKSFSFEDVLPDSLGLKSDKYLWPTVDLHGDKEKKPAVKLFGGEVKIVNTSGENRSYRLENSSRHTSYSSDPKGNDYSSKLSKNHHVVKSGLQSGGTVLTNKTLCNKETLTNEDEVGSVYKTRVDLPISDMSTPNKTKITFTISTPKDNPTDIISQLPEGLSSLKPIESPSYNYLNITDFSQKAAKLLAPNLKRPNLSVLGVTLSSSSVSKGDSQKTYKSTSGGVHHLSQVNGEVPPVCVFPDSSEKDSPRSIISEPSVVAVDKSNQNLFTPMNLLVNGKIIRYVPGMPGPVTTEEPMEISPIKQVPEPTTPLSKKYPMPEPIDHTSQYNSRDQEKISIPTFKHALQIGKPSSLESQTNPLKNTTQDPEEKSLESKSSTGAKSKFVRPNSLALKPSVASLKQHHGLTPTMFNQILISPDTPRVAKKYVQQFLHGNYFSYLGLKSSTRPVYCTLNKTQPFYTLHFKKLSMYSEWRQQDNKIDKLFASAYDSRQKQQNYNMAGKVVDLIVHSSYKFILSELHSPKQDKGEEVKSSVILGGYESKEDYTYIRGRGRGRYVCDQCGIRCKKPSMLKKHIRTHSNDRPYTCAHCNFSFKTKGNLTKHMKSKAHTKNTSGSSTNSTSQQPFTQSSESETEDSGMDSSDESTRQQEHEAAYGLLTLSQKSTQNVLPSPQPYIMTSCSLNSANEAMLRSHPLSDVVNIMDTEEIVHVTKINYAKNKILDEQRHFSLPPPKHLNIGKESMDIADDSSQLEETTEKSSTGRPLTYPYTSAVFVDGKVKHVDDDSTNVVFTATSPRVSSMDIPQNLSSPSVFSPSEKPSNQVGDIFDKNGTLGHSLLIVAKNKSIAEPYKDIEQPADRKRKILFDNSYNKDKIQKNDDVIDLSVCGVDSAPMSVVTHITSPNRLEDRITEIAIKERAQNMPRDGYGMSVLKAVDCHQTDYGNNVEISYKQQCLESGPDTMSESSNIEYDNSAMETLADVATKQVKLEKNTLAKSVASEYLKLVTKTEYPGSEGVIENYNMVGMNKDVNELIVKPEENKSCTICSKNFSKSSHLRLHMNIHYLERPFRCDSCSVSFRTKGHLQKHERSASHHNKLTSSPALLSSEPRPFKCLDCNIAFRIHGHLAKHLRSKMHIMKLECLAKIPFGLYAELERSNSLLTEINTVDGDQCLESLKVLAKKVFTNDPSKLNPMETSEFIDPDS